MSSIKKWQHYSCVMAVSNGSNGSARRGEHIACLLLWLEKEMATHPSILAWRIPGTGDWWAAVYGVTQNRTRLKWLSSSRSCSCSCYGCCASQERINVSVIPMAPRCLLPASLLLPCLSWVQQTVQIVWTTRYLSSGTGSEIQWDFPGKNPGVGCHLLLQGIFPTQGLNLCLLCLLHCQQTLYWLSRRGSHIKHVNIVGGAWIWNPEELSLNCICHFFKKLENNYFINKMLC